MTYPKFSFKNLDPNAKIVFLENNDPEIFYHKIWTISIHRDYDITNNLEAHNVSYRAYLNHDTGIITYHFNSEQERDDAKFLI